MSKYFILTGQGRTATKWLADMLNKGTNAHVTHEPFRPTTWPKAFNEWINIKTNAKIIGCANSYARHWISEIDIEIKPTWVMLWREPLSHVKSAWQRTQRNFWHVVHALFAELEATLIEAENNNIPISHWYFNHYTTKDGLIMLADHLGVKFDGNIKLLPPGNVAIDPIPRPPTQNWSTLMHEHVFKYMSNLPHVRKSYKQARKRYIKGM